MDRFAHHFYCIFLACALSALSCPSLASDGIFPELPATAGLSTRVAELSTQLIVRWEVGSPARYARLYQSVYWPGGASGPTWGIGYDGGQQTPESILRDWSVHPDKQSLARAAGITGQQAQRIIARWHGVITPFSYAKSVFSARSLPAFALQTRRTLGKDFAALPEPTQAALHSLGYNRGWGMLGARNVEKRTIKNVCVPNRDAQCVATQLSAMCRLWRGTPNGAGLCARRMDEAHVAVQI